MTAPEDLRLHAESVVFILHFFCVFHIEAVTSTLKNLPHLFLVGVLLYSTFKRTFDSHFLSLYIIIIFFTSGLFGSVQGPVTHFLSVILKALLRRHTGSAFFCNSLCVS